jgi:chromosome segregation ATPase
MRVQTIILLIIITFYSCNEIVENDENIKELKNDINDIKSELEEKELELEEAKKKLSEINNIIDELDEEVSSLRGHISDFDYHDWEIIIEDVKYRSGNVEDLVEKLKSYYSEDSRYGRRGRLN